MYVQTNLLDHEPFDVVVMGHEPKDLRVPQCDHPVNRVAVTVRQIGWIDQKGVVYPINEVPEVNEFRGGSLTPLLINPGCD